MKEGQSLIISGSSSTLGLYINRFAKARGILVINLVRNEKQIPLCEGLGYEFTFVYDVEDQSSWDGLIGKIMTVTHGGADAGIDMIGGKVPNIILNSMKPFTTMISVGTSSDSGIDITPLITTGRLLMEGKRIQGFSVNKCWSAQTPREKIVNIFNECCRFFYRDDGIVHCPVGKFFYFSQITEAVFYSGGHTNSFGGKALISPDGTNPYNEEDYKELHN